MVDPKALRLAIALADIRGQHDFHDSLGYWHEDAPEPTEEWFRTLQPQTIPRTITNEDDVLEVTDCRADVTAPHGSAIHVYGDLSACINVTGHCEVIVAGDVLENGSIRGDGIVRVYIAGNLCGTVENKSSSRVWVAGDLLGQIGTGQPSADVRVMGNCLGSIHPIGKPALLYLEVCGFMPFAAVQKTGSVGYTQFNAVLQSSDCPAGFYPDRFAHKQLADHRSHNRWVVLAEQRQRAS